MALMQTPAADSGSKDIDAVLEKLHHRIELAEKRTAHESASIPPATSQDATKTIGPPLCKRGITGTPTNHAFQLPWLDLEREGRLTKRSLMPESEYPTFLTRIPVFLPSRRTNQRQLLDADNALPFESPWTRGLKHGPPLTTYDEDTLIALGRLRQSLLIGDRKLMPIPVSDVFSMNSDSNVRCHVLFCMISDIQSFCGTTRGGKTNKLRLESLRRLSNVSFDFENSSSKFIVYGVSGLALMQIAWQAFEENAVLYIQFTPFMARCFEQEYTFIDWSVRRELSSTGKAVHRFLSSQTTSYEIHTEKLRQIIGYPRDHHKFLADLRGAMDQLEQCRWVQSYRILGTGKKTPKKLVIVR